MKVWAFCTYKWQGNPKALFLYMTKYMQHTHECWWVADNSQDARTIKSSGFENVTFNGSEQAKKIFSKTDVYVSENFRERYPEELSVNAKVFNTWHGVGLKHIELGIDFNSIISDAIIRKNIRNVDIYKNRSMFLVTSDEMKKHFLHDTMIHEGNVVKAGYPRNSVYSDVNLSTYDFNKVLKKPAEDYSKIAFFAPTWRTKRTKGIFQYLLPDLKKIEEIFHGRNELLIIKVHPLMQSDPLYIADRESFKNSESILFWDDAYDIYEIFSIIDYAIVDYSSIFYDLLSAGVNKFIRYIPDYDEYTRDSELIGDYFSLTDGVLCRDFNELIEVFEKEIPLIENKEKLIDYFFKYKEEKTIQELVDEVDGHALVKSESKELHSFDIFDTLIRRKTVTPSSIFTFVQKSAKDSGLHFPDYVLDGWEILRTRAEHDVRDMFKKTTFERGTDTVEIKIDDIFKRVYENYDLSREQIDFLKNKEIEAEINNVDAIRGRIEFLFKKIEEGNDVILVSDMYLPESVIRQMLQKADPRLQNIPLYLSSKIGHQKSTGKLYKHIFFEKKYEYQRWVHYGDNKHADGVVPRSLGIEAFTHRMDDFIPYEKIFIEKISPSLKFDGCRLSAMMHRYRLSLLSSGDNSLIENKYYAFAYAGLALVPYVHWCILDAIRRKYEVLYFISRDGHFLKKIADRIIEKNNFKLKTKYIYGSRKLWRVPSFIEEVDEETFGPFGNFVGLDSFDDLVRASLISEEELLQLFPQFSELKNEKNLRGEVAENIRKTLSCSDEYKAKILNIASERRVLVREYLKQSIDFNEKFAFVEFWGRGYTQDVFSRLLNDAAGFEVKNAFYYARSFTENKKNILRHNFVLSSQNFSYFEPIFAATPYKSIESYCENESGQVIPVIIEQPNEMASHLEDGLLNFVDGYLGIAKDNQNFIRGVAGIAYDYQIKNKNDQFICNVYADLKDNISSYGEVSVVAPPLSLNDLKKAVGKKDLDVLTKDISISLARSVGNVREFYIKNLVKMKWPKVNVDPVNINFVVNDLSKYVFNKKTPFKVISAQNNAIYFDISMSPESKRQDLCYHQFDVIEVVAVDWLSNGVPRLLTNWGYITANREYIHPVDEENINSALVGLKLMMSGIERRLLDKKMPHIKINLKNNLKDSPKVKEVNAKDDVSTRKWMKFVRSPYEFLKDSKSKKWRRMSFVFNEKYLYGRATSGFVRKFF